MSTQQKYPHQQARCLYFDANGNKVSQPSQDIARALDPWLALQELVNRAETTS
ncbi:MAG TPA: hypothetical protein VLL05_21995 [Terriglobales bacterium]|nr:hypothetical protein [Terriglobales bacterium]